MNCIKCEKEIEQTKQSRSKTYVSAVVGKITAKEGSEFEGTTFQIAICDKCIQDNAPYLQIQDSYNDWETDITWP